MNKSDQERIAVLEMMVLDLKDTQGRIEKKLDGLIELKNKGAGAFWLASALFGIIFAVLGTNVISWIKA